MSAVPKGSYDALLWPPRQRVAALLCDRDDTIVADVPYNGDPDRVRLLPGVRAALDRARAAGLKLAIVTNQSAVGLGLISADDVDAVHRRLVELAGPFDAIEVCPHHPRQGCTCRKPQPDLVTRAAEHLGVPVEACVMVGDTVADMRAAASAGAAGILVPAPSTRPEERTLVPCAVATFEGAVALALEYAA